MDAGLVGLGDLRVARGAGLGNSLVKDQRPRVIGAVDGVSPVTVAAGGRVAALGDLAAVYAGLVGLEGLAHRDPEFRDHLGIRVTDPAGSGDVIVVEGRVGIGAGQQRVNPSVAVGALRRLVVTAHATSAVDAVLPLGHDVLVATRASGPQLGLGMGRPFRLEVAVDAVEKAVDRVFEGVPVGLVAFGAVFHRSRRSCRDERDQQEEPDSRGRADRFTLDHHD